MSTPITPQAGQAPQTMYPALACNEGSPVVYPTLPVYEPTNVDQATTFVDPRFEELLKAEMERRAQREVDERAHYATISQIRESQGNPSITFEEYQAIVAGQEIPRVVVQIKPSAPCALAGLKAGDLAPESAAHFGITPAQVKEVTGIDLAPSEEPKTPVTMPAATEEASSFPPTPPSTPVPADDEPSMPTAPSPVATPAPLEETPSTPPAPSTPARVMSVAKLTLPPPPTSTSELRMPLFEAPKFRNPAELKAARRAVLDTGALPFESAAARDADATLASTYINHIFDNGRTMVDWDGIDAAFQKKYFIEMIRLQDEAARTYGISEDSFAQRLNRIQQKAAAKLVPALARRAHEHHFMSGMWPEGALTVHAKVANVSLSFLHKHDRKKPKKLPEDVVTFDKMQLVIQEKALPIEEKIREALEVLVPVIGMDPATINPEDKRNLNIWLIALKKELEYHTFWLGCRDAELNKIFDAFEVNRATVIKDLETVLR